VDGEIEKLKAIQNLPDVLAADLVYAFSDDD
jgi:nitrate reductase NapAB chaperone NapD